MTSTEIAKQSRHLMRFSLIEEVSSDLRFALRVWRRQPLFTATAVLMLALAIGVNATVFSWLQVIVFDPLPGAAQPGSLVSVLQTDPTGTLLPFVSYPDFQDLERTTDIFAGVIGTRATSAILERDGRSVWVSAAVASANTFGVLGVRAEEGRTFTTDESQGEGGHAVIVMSDGLWHRQFGGDRSIVGRAVRLNRQLFTVVGVLPPTFQGINGGSRIDVWAPLGMHDAVLNYGSYASRTFRWIQPLARLRAGVDAERARAALAVVSARLATAYPDSNAGIRFDTFPLWRSPLGGQAAFLPALRIVFAMAVAMLLIVIADLSCLLLARTTSRQNEVTIRLAIGAGRFRLVRQFLVESVTLAAAGGSIGLLLAHWLIRLLPFIAPASAALYQYDFAVGGTTVAFTAGLTLLVSMSFGLAPAVIASRQDLGNALTSRGASAGRHHRRALGGLVTAEVALALVLLIAAGLCLKGFRRAKQIDLGFDPSGVLYASFNLVPTGYNAERARIFDRTLRQQLSQSPGVSDVAFVNTPPLGANGTFTATVDVEGHDARAGESRTVRFLIASPGYFPVMRIPLLSGRDFDESDDSTRPHAAIVNDTMAKRYWPGLDPVGHRFQMAAGISSTETFTVIGVASTSKYDSVSEPPTPAVYVTYLQRPIASLFMNALVRVTQNSDAVVATIRREVHTIDPSVEPLRLVSMREYIQTAFVPIQTATVLLATLAAAAIFLALAGLYAVMSYSVSQRSREIGIRLALGARPRDAIWVILKEGFTFVSAGVAIGQVVSLASSRSLAGLLYGTSATDPMTFWGGAVVLLLVASLACIIPAKRASRVDPAETIRAE